MGDSILANSMMEFYVFDPIVCDGFSNPLNRERERAKNPVDREKLQEKVWKMFTDGHWIRFFCFVNKREQKTFLTVY